LFVKPTSTAVACGNIKKQLE